MQLFFLACPILRCKRKSPCMHCYCLAKLGLGTVWVLSLDLQLQRGFWGQDNEILCKVRSYSLHFPLCLHLTARSQFSVLFHEHCDSRLCRLIHRYFVAKGQIQSLIPDAQISVCQRSHPSVLSLLNNSKIRQVINQPK